MVALFRLIHLIGRLVGSIFFIVLSLEISDGVPGHNLVVGLQF